ncbi:MAG: hypothetical protein M1351_02155 [Candidatus Thermoplasmatota archaeon]|nr:hypothetical protein [Candidatus Thermoplasmatota archaeon]
MTSATDTKAIEELPERLRSLIKQYRGLLKRKRDIEKAIGDTEQSIRQILGGAKSVDLPISSSSRTLFYRVQLVTTVRKIIDPRSLIESYGMGAYEAMSVIVSMADALMKRGTEEQFRIATQGMIEKTSEPFLRISVVRGRNGRSESAPSSSSTATPRPSSSSVNEGNTNV